MPHDDRRPALLLLVLVMACKSGSTPGGPSVPGVPTAPTPNPGPPPAQVCRNFAARARWDVTTTTSGLPGFPGTTITATQNQSCTFDRGTASARCESNWQSAGCTVDSVQTIRWASVADFVDEVDVVGRALALESTGQGSGMCPGGALGSSPPATQRFSYDSQRRLVRIETIVNPSVTSTITYTAWDSRDRPTAGTIVTPGISAGTFRQSYDDSARTIMWEAVAAGQMTTTTTTLDADGNLAGVRLATTGLTSTATITTSEIVRVCK